MLDQVVLVDQQDRPIGVADKTEAHRGEGKLHRAISVFLFNQHGELLLQQRSAKKITAKLLWANTCCGNVRPGETYKACAVRRLKEELGIVGVGLTKVTKFTYQVKCDDEFGEHEIDTVYMGRYDGEVYPNPEEVNGFRWMALEDLRVEMLESGNQFVPWLHVMQKRGIVERL